MICAKCNNDLATCTCSDMPERLDSIKTCPHLYIGPDYLKRLEAHAAKVRKQRRKQQADAE